MDLEIYFDYKKYGRPHQMFVQGLMTRGIIDPDEFDHLFNLCLLRAKGKKVFFLTHAKQDLILENSRSQISRIFENESSVWIGE